MEYYCTPYMMQKDHYKIAPSQNSEENQAKGQERQGILDLRGLSQDGIDGSLSVLVGVLSENSSFKCITFYA